MIVKVALASVLLLASTALIAPIALAARDTEGCVETTTTDTPSSPNPRQPASAGLAPAPTECQTPSDAGGALAGADQAVARAMNLVGSHGYYQLCARLAANIWGRPRAGYFSAAEQWRQVVATNNAHPGDRLPPTGALVFWDTGGPYGHVAVYVGDDRIVSNDIGDTIPGEGGVYLVDFALIESQWGATYLGWAPPIYSTT
ncbi:CHAP domain-containing protein [Kribbella sindirgiensis]|uniref:CHAP domain-containing protein n=1 Tax=Kribbella sindirgiensis TaxID=1124744 RepID=A0A4R0IQS2_9ACTN|nr:CHAP domain-containing protein [Kribbella sindirgiensis]TCC34950.1 CHAP domain-containing protein [Kribbella sindirgiensis]